MKTVTISDDVEAITLGGVDFMVSALKEIAEADPFTLYRFKREGPRMIMYSYTIVSGIDEPGVGHA